jgi:hypothetical protein
LQSEEGNRNPTRSSSRLNADAHDSEWLDIESLAFASDSIGGMVV